MNAKRARGALFFISRVADGYVERIIRVLFLNGFLSEVIKLMPATLSTLNLFTLEMCRFVSSQCYAWMQFDSREWEIRLKFAPTISTLRKCESRIPIFHLIS